MGDTRVSAYASIQEAALYLNVSEDTIRRLIRAKKLPAIKVGRVIRISWADLKSALEPAVK